MKNDAQTEPTKDVPMGTVPQTFGPKHMTLEEVALAFYQWGRGDNLPVDRLPDEELAAMPAADMTVGGVSLDRVRRLAVGQA